MPPSTPHPARLVAGLLPVSRVSRLLRYRSPVELPPVLTASLPCSVHRRSLLSFVADSPVLQCTSPRRPEGPLGRVPVVTA